MQRHPHPAPPRRNDLLSRLRAWPAIPRHGGAAAAAAGLAALPAFGLPVAPAGQPFLPVLAIIAAALLFGRGSAATAAVAAAAVAGALMLASGAADAARAALSLVAFLMVALGMAAAVEAMRGIFALMDGADERRRAGILVPAPAPSPRLQALRLLAMPPEQRRRMTRAR